MPDTPPYSKYVCWTPGAVLDTVVTEAISPSDAVFLATHHPSPIGRQRIRGAGNLEAVDEGTLVDELLAEGRDMVLMPVVGASGSGKSHLVRWVATQLRARALPSHRIVYIPKYGTSLRGVIELIIGDMEGPVVRQLRESLREAHDAINEQEAPDELLDGLARAVQHRAYGEKGLEQHIDPERAEWLRIGLPTILRDSVFRAVLLEPEGIVKRFVAEAIGGRRREDHDEPYTFAPSDFPDVVPSLGRANADAQEAYTYIIGDPATREAAATLLTYHLQGAVQDLFGVGEDTLVNVMREVRKAIRERGEELVLLIEDFAILQGIQRDLLDAITDAPTRDGNQDLCTIRTLLAVTSGYWDSMADTVQTRAAFASHKYDLDIPYGESGLGISTESAVDFVGRYLNAARLGQQAIDRALDATDHPDALDSWVPNACDDCLFQEECHAAFGVSKEGYGIYPFNALALTRAIQGALPSQAFDPRALLSEVLVRTLNNYSDDIDRGEFPNEEWANAYSQSPFPRRTIDADLRHAIGRTSDAERRTVLLEYWGGVPEHLCNLAGGIHSAFDLPMVEGVSDTPIVPPPVVVNVPEHRVPPKDDALDLQMKEIDEWASSDKALGMETSRELRKLLHKDLLQHLELEHRLVRESSDLFESNAGVILAQQSFAIEASTGGRGGKPTIARFELKRDDRENGVLFRGLIRAQRNGAWDFEGATTAYTILAEKLHTWESLVLDALGAYSATADEPWDAVRDVVALLAFSSRLAGVPGGESDDPLVMLRALFESALPPADTGNDLWDQLVVLSIEARRPLQAILDNLTAVARRGTVGVDGARIIPILEQFLSVWTLPSSPPPQAPNVVKDYHRRLSSLLESAIDSRYRHAERLSDEVQELLGASQSLSDLGERIVRALLAATHASVLRPEGSGEAQRLRALELAGKSFESVETAVAAVGCYASADQDGERIAALVGLDIRAVEVIEELASNLAGTLQDSIDEAESVVGAGAHASPRDNLGDSLRLAVARTRNVLGIQESS